MKAAWEGWFERQLDLDSERLIFIDETSASTKIVRLYGRSPKGERCLAAVPHGHWKTTTFTAGLRIDGLAAPFVLDGLMDGDAFRAYVEQVLEDGRRDPRSAFSISAQRNKTNAAATLGIAHIMRTGWFRQAYIKTEACYRMRLLLSQRRNLKRKYLDIENTIGHSLKAFGIRLGGTSRGAFDQAVREAVADDKLTNQLMDAMLSARAALWKEYCQLHNLVVKFVARNELCRRFKAINVQLNRI